MLDHDTLEEECGLFIKETGNDEIARDVILEDESKSFEQTPALLSCDIH